MKSTIIFCVILVVLIESEGVKVPGLTSLLKCNEYYELGIIPGLKCGLNVYGGVPALPNHLGVEFMAALGSKNGSKKVVFCGGTLISEYFILTAAQCLLSSWLKVEFIRLGDLNIASSSDDFDAQEFKVSEYFIHPSYKKPIKYNDLALIKLDKPAVFTSAVFPVCLLPKQVDLNNKDFYVAGWGAPGFGEEGSDNLQVAELQYYNMTKCQKSYRSERHLPESIKPESQICALGQVDSADTCQGDSGGPLIYKYNTSPERVVYYIAGITSFGRICGLGFPSVYTRVSHYIGWIENIVWPNSN